MSDAKADIGLIGLAVMGQNLVLNMSDHGYTVAVHNRTREKTTDFLTGPAISDDDFLAALPDTGPGGINGNISSADDDDFFTGQGFVAQSDVSQKINGNDHLRIIILTGNSQFIRLVRADRQKKRLKAFMF